jgi:hypothetical protein
MEKKPRIKITSALVLLLFCIPAFTGCSSQEKSSQESAISKDKNSQEVIDSKNKDSQEGELKEKTSSPVPPENAQLWKSLQELAQKDYDVCLEHCGGEQSCLDRCASAYKHRLENDYKRVTQ